MRSVGKYGAACPKKGQAGGLTGKRICRAGLWRPATIAK